MNVQNIKIRNEEKENVDAFGNWLKVRTISVFGNVREHFKQIRVQQVLAENNRNHPIKAPKQDILNNLSLAEKHSLGLYHLMD